VGKRLTGCWGAKARAVAGRRMRAESFMIRFDGGK